MLLWARSIYILGVIESARIWGEILERDGSESVTVTIPSCLRIQIIRMYDKVSCFQYTTLLFWIIIHWLEKCYACIEKIDVCSLLA